MIPQMTDRAWQDYIAMLLHRRWYVLIPLALSVSASVALCFVLPKIYKSTTVILVEQQKVPEAYVKSSVSIDLDERLSTIQQQIMSRSLLRSVIGEFGLYKKEAERVTPDEIVEIMRKNVEVKVDKGKKNIEAFSISYSGTDANTVMLVTNKLASLFIEENLKVREEFVEGTSAFLDNELNGIKVALEAQENKIREFKQQYVGELPEQTAANLHTLDRLQLELQTIHEALSKAKEQRAALLEREPGLGSLNLDRVTAREIGNIDPSRLRLAQLQVELANLQAQFTDKYPDVIRLKKEIADLEEKSQVKISKDAKASSGSSSKDGSKTDAHLKDMLENDGPQRQFNQVRLDIRHFEERQKQIETQIEAYEARVEKAPLREQQMLGLVRDYENTKLHYQALLDKKLNARISENLEKRQKAEQFRILDPANLPDKPYKPDPFRIVLLGLVVGLSTGGGAAYLRETMDVSFKRPEEVEMILHHPVLISIPNIHETLKHKRKSA